MERNKRSYHVPRLVAVRLTVYIAANIKSKYLRLFYLNLSNDEISFYLQKFQILFIDPIRATNVNTAAKDIPGLRKRKDPIAKVNDALNY